MQPWPLIFTISFPDQVNLDDVAGTESGFDPFPKVCKSWKGKLGSPHIGAWKTEPISEKTSSSDIVESSRIFPQSP